MNITVFGGAGFLGSHVCDKLSEAGHSVSIADLRKSPWLRDGQRMLTGNVLDASFVCAACQGADQVFNFAGIADLNDADAAPVETANVNVMGNIHILEACRKMHISRYIFASSLYVYGKHGGFYRCSKQSCELFIEEYHRKYGINYTILRYGSLYGPRSDLRNGIFKFVSEAMNIGCITYYGSPQALREYIHVEDAALSTLDVIKSEFANENLVITGAQPMRVADLFVMIGEILGKKLEIHYEERPDNAHYLVTPYSFMPKKGRKMFPTLATDLGQGILRVMAEVYENQNKH